MSRVPKRYRMRIRALSSEWLLIQAYSEEEAIEQAVKRINSKTIDYSARELWEIEDIDGKETD